jgi:uncharacterized membrane protein HdeD (DUF308 family)
MVQIMARNWWLFALRGVIALLAGIAIFVSPGIFIAMFAAFMLLDGIFTIVHSLSGRAGNPNWWVALLEGVIGVIAGGIAFLYPGIAAVTLVYVVAAWAILGGIAELFAAWQLRKSISNEFWLGLSGLVTVIFGIVLLLNPLAGFLTLSTFVAAFAIISGILSLVLAFRLRGMITTP